MSQQEQPWFPGPNDVPWTVALINPHGDRHLAMNPEEGRMYRLWQHRAPQPLHWGEAILLRPSDIDSIVKHAMLWVINNPGNPHSYQISDEISAGTKAAVDHFAGLAGAQ